MFDSGFSEIALILIIALIVFGPERLPELARKTGYWIGKFRRYMDSMRSEIEREINADELRTLLSKQEHEINELRDMLQDTRTQMRDEMGDINRELGITGEALHKSLNPPVEGGPPADISPPELPPVESPEQLHSEHNYKSKDHERRSE